MALVRWTPFKELLDMPRGMEMLFSRPFTSMLEEPWPGGGGFPLLDVFAKGDDLMVRLELPGIKLDDIDISLCDNTLCISGERSEETEVSEDDYYRRERSFGHFERSLPIPDKVTEDDIDAVYKDGILEITVAGAATTSPVKHIKVKAAGGKGERKHVKAGS